MFLKILSIASILILPALSLANEIPKSLFGITLDKTYRLGDWPNGDKGEFPVKRFLYLNYDRRHLEYYFEPIKPYEAFKYIEYDKNSLFKSSFVLQLSPIGPSFSSDLRRNGEFSAKVVSISWHDLTGDIDSLSQDRLWAVDMCGLFSEDLNIKPVVTNDTKKAYTCQFQSDGRVLIVNSSILGKTINLRIDAEVLKSLRIELKDKTDKDKIERIRPYE